MVYYNYGERFITIMVRVSEWFITIMVRVCVHVRLTMHKCDCKCMYVCICIYMRMYMRMYMCMHMCMYVCMYAHAHVCLYACSLSLPTLLISECVLIYLKPADAKEVVSWASAFFTG